VASVIGASTGITDSGELLAGGDPEDDASLLRLARGLAALEDQLNTSQSATARSVRAVAKGPHE
jgi:hypothetical protein